MLAPGLPITRPLQWADFTGLQGWLCAAYCRIEPGHDGEFWLRQRQPSGALKTIGRYETVDIAKVVAQADFAGAAWVSLSDEIQKAILPALAADRLVAELFAAAKALMESVSYDMSGINGQGGNGGLISTETIRRSDELHQVILRQEAVI